MKRLGIQQVLNQPIDWGDDYYKGIEPNEEWKHNVMMARMLMSENLCICSQATLELMKLWQDYKSYLFVSLPAKREEPLPLVEFLSNQDQQMSKIKGLLSSDWNKSAVDILREELENLDKDQTKTFFESVATLMANQVRELIEQSVHTYVDFIQRYKSESYPEPDEILQREYDADSPFEDNFISLKLAREENDDAKIVFSDPLDNVQHELEKIVDLIVQQSSNLPRPENTIARSDKMHLWDVQVDDELVTKAKTKISETLSENLKIVQKAVNVYDEYLWILKEKARVEDFINNPDNYDKVEFQALIDKFRDTINQIREEMPFEIRMNMFLIKCGDINNLLCEECEDIIDVILRKVGDLVFIQWANKITQDVKNIQEQNTQKSNNSNELVKYEKRLEDVKNIEHKRLNQHYTDLVEWLVMLNKNPKYRTQDDTFKQVQHAYKHINMINNIVDKSETKLKNERTEIENGLMEQTRRFTAKIEEQKALVIGFKDKNQTKSMAAQDYLYKDIKGINEALQWLTEEKQRIHDQQADLEMMLGEYPEIDALKPQVRMYEDLWTLYIRFSKAIGQWINGPLNQLNPQEVADDHKEMLRASTRLCQKFETAKLPKPEAVAKKMKTELTDFKQWIPIIDALCNKGLKTRHINEITQIVGMNVSEKETKLDTLRNLQVDKYKDALEEISDRASKEWNNEKIMKQMKDAWEPLKFLCKEVPGKASKILQGDAIEEIQTILDDHIIKTQTMKGSPFAKFMLPEITVWEELLMTTQDNLDLWLKVQAVWMYLEPVFSSDDIINQMPVEG